MLLKMYRCTFASITEFYAIITKLDISFLKQGKMIVCLKSKRNEVLSHFLRVEKKIYLGFWSHLLSERSFTFALKINTNNCPRLSFIAYKYTPLKFWRECERRGGSITMA